MIWRILFAMSTEAKITSHTHSVFFLLPFECAAFHPNSRFTCEACPWSWLCVPFPPNNTLMHVRWCVGATKSREIETISSLFRNRWLKRRLYLSIAEELSRIIYDWSMVEQKKKVCLSFWFLLFVRSIHSPVAVAKNIFLKFNRMGKGLGLHIVGNGTLLTSKKLKDISIQFFFLFHIFDITFT